MKRLFTVMLASAAIACLSGFSLFTVSPATARIRWDTQWAGPAYTTPLPDSTALYPSFVSDGYAGVGGLSIWRGDGISCNWGIPGDVDGGAVTAGGNNTIVMDIMHEDAGIDCSCTLSTPGVSPAACITATTAGLGSFASCSCPAFQTIPGSTYIVQIDPSTKCESKNPAQWHCAVDLFR